MAGELRIGCSGWVYKDWRGSFYPEKMPQREWLAHYSREFDTVEINNTFYRLPSEAAVKGWVEQTPDGFAYAVKASRYLTHVKKLKGLAQVRQDAPVQRSGADERRRQAGRRALAAARRTSTATTSACGSRSRRCPRARHAFEFRHPSWFCDDVYALLHQPQRRAGRSPTIPRCRSRTTASTRLTGPTSAFTAAAAGATATTRATEIERWARRIRGVAARARRATPTSTTTSAGTRLRNAEPAEGAAQGLVI